MVGYYNHENQNEAHLSVLHGCFGQREKRLFDIVVCAKQVVLVGHIFNLIGRIMQSVEPSTKAPVSVPVV